MTAPSAGGSLTCPNGHTTTATDYCDVCGVAMPTGGPAPQEAHAPAPTSAGSLDLDSPAPAASPDTVPCPNCGAPNPPDALFCEACGYDHTTGTMPRRDVAGSATAGPATAGPATADPNPTNPSPALEKLWVAELWIDAAWYATQDSADPLPSPGLPTIVPLRHTSLLIGRPSASRGITPDLDCGMDSGVSRRHAQLTTDGTRWWVEDLGSANGTYLGDAVGELPASPIPAGQRRELDDDDRIYVGAWTRIVVRASTEDELTTLGG